MNVFTGRNDIEKYVGSMRQVAGIKRYTLDEGFGRGLRAADVSTGSGLAFSVLFDRGMDLGPASYKGVPLSFMTSVGDFPNSAFYSSPGIDWLRSFGGGLLAGCGLRNVGSPASLNGENLPLHGRLSNIPAFNTSVCEEWRDGRYVLELSGSMRESRFFGENLLLSRRITTELGSSSIEIKDRVENQSGKPDHVMLLYHINLGYPMLCENSVLKAVEHDVQPRDTVAEKGLSSWKLCQKPVSGYSEQCFYHDIPADDDGFSRISMLNPRLGLEFEVASRKAELPFLTQWKQMGEGAYVTGLEPANCHVEGALSEQERGTLRMIAAGESIEFCIRLSVKEI